jgi:DNA mismatch endonuclease (patch repair protein)
MPGSRLAIFADGCFWHGCPKHGRTPDDNADYWVPKLARNIARAREVSQRLKASGIRTVRLWEHDLKPRTISAAMRRIRRAALTRAGARKPPLAVASGTKASIR